MAGYAADDVSMDKSSTTEKVEENVGDALTTTKIEPE
jgi:hypothetical protein